LEAITQWGDDSEDIGLLDIGLTFSFPCKQHGINSTDLEEWTKEFETGRATNDPVENRDVCELLNVAFKRNNIKAHVNAVVNDTVATLVSCAYEQKAVNGNKRECVAGVILGTGSNACYVEPRASLHGYKGIIINIESGAFDKELPLTNVDQEVDFASSSRGHYLFEKMHSGAYLGEICRRVLVKILQDEAPVSAWRGFTFSSEDACSLVNDESAYLDISEKVVMKKWDVKMSIEHLRLFKAVCTSVVNRSAACAAVLLAASAKKTGRLQAAMGGVTVAVDGSLYLCNPWYQTRVQNYLVMLLGSETASLLSIVLADDAPGKGAAILAAMH